jgi:histidine triad (HIT) family protein
MPISKEQAQQLKKQLLQQVDQLPQENKEQIKEYIKDLDEAGLEEFLKQNKIKYQEGDVQAQPEKPVFQSIVEGDVPSYKIAENDKALAILEINPLSKGHCIILPKQACSVEKLPKSVLTLAQKIASRIKQKLKADDIKIETSSFQDYPMINIIPIYKGEQLQKKKAEEKDLEKLKNKLETKTRAKRGPKLKKQDLDKLPKIGFRIP